MQIRDKVSADYQATNTNAEQAAVAAKTVKELLTGLGMKSLASKTDHSSLLELLSTPAGNKLELVLELATRILGQKLKLTVLSNSTEVRQYLRLKLRGLKVEHFAAVFLDNSNRVVSYEVLAVGTVDGATVHPRVVLDRALANNAAAVIFAHNHPSGVSEPSQADCAITRRLRNSLGLIDIRVLDHIVVGEGEITSMAERGLI